MSDLIDRQQAMDIIFKHDVHDGRRIVNVDRLTGAEWARKDIFEMIKKMPSVDPAGDSESDKYALAKKIKEDLVAYISNMHDEHGNVLIEIANNFRNYAALNGDMEAVK